jgi:tRNA (guanine-N7-)-methyltransferase
LRTIDDLLRPWYAVSLFGRAAPLEVEIGSGKGMFLASAGAARPERNFLGIELAKSYAHVAAARAAKQKLSNVRVIAGDALRVFSQILPDASAASVHIYFPDPWWKKRHHKRRVMTPALVKDVERVLQPGGALHFWTDVEEYFRNSLDLLASETTLEGPLDVPERPPEHDLDYRTHFERRMRLGGKPVYRAEFRRGHAGSNTEATQIAIAIAEHDGRYLIGQRPPGTPLAGLWEFPGGKILPNETPQAAAARECLEETGLDVVVGAPYPTVTHEYPHGSVKLHFFACRPVDPTQQPRPPFEWVEAARLGDYPFPSANAAILKSL